jgi:hypothetical protein
MIRPWQVWLVFAVCVICAIGAMVWLTREAVEADRQRRAAQADAELEQRVSLALWRMDTELAPIIAQEVVRPVSAYRAPSAVVPPPEFVSLLFEVRKDGPWFSPQAALSKDERGKFNDLRIAASFEQLLSELPDTPSPLVATGESNAADSLVKRAANEQHPYVENRLKPPANTNAAPSETSSQVAQSKVADFAMRGKRYQSAAEQSFQNYELNQAANAAKAATSDDNVRAGPPKQMEEQIGISRPLWFGDQLVLARRVVSGGKTIVQGCLFDWPRLKKHLLEEAADLLPNADLVPADPDSSEDPGRMLAGLPVRLVVGESAANARIGSTLRWALWFGWGGVLFAVAAAAALLHGVMTLSERRAAFVSSVTHELRTPLTTFRMYAEMLARGMVPDAARRQEYFETLQREAERLTLLVENVLAYARLERGRKPQGQDRVTLQSLLDRVGPRLKQRAAQAEMECVIELPLPLGEGFHVEFTTDLAVVEQILFNLACYPFKRLNILRPCVGDDFGWQFRRRAVLIPAAGGEPVADELFVERRLAAAGLVLIGRPEPRAVGRQHFVDEDQLVVDQAELELGVGNDDALARRELGAARVEVDAPLRQLFAQLAADAGAHVVVGNILVVQALLGFGGRCEDRAGQLVAFCQASGKFDAAHGAGLLIFAPCRPRKITAHDTLDWHHAGLPHEHRAALEWLAVDARRQAEVVHLARDHVVRHILEVLEPKPAQLREHAAFIRNAARQHPVERADAIGAHEEQRIAEVVNIAHLSAAHGQIGKRCCRNGRRHGGI